LIKNKDVEILKQRGEREEVKLKFEQNIEL